MNTATETSKYKHTLNPAQREEIRNMLGKGASPTVLARAMGLPFSTVYWYVSEAKGKQRIHNPSSSIKEKKPVVRKFPNIDTETRKEIGNKLRGGIDAKFLAKEYGIGIASVYYFAKHPELKRIMLIPETTFVANQKGVKHDSPSETTRYKKSIAKLIIKSKKKEEQIHTGIAYEQGMKNVGKDALAFIKSRDLLLDFISFLYDHGSESNKS